MSELKDMPVVTVEQVHRFRQLALEENAKLREELAAATGWKDEAMMYCKNADYWKQRAEAAEAKLSAVPVAVKNSIARLVRAARTSGGVAGADTELQAACKIVEFYFTDGQLLAAAPTPGEKE